MNSPHGRAFVEMVKGKPMENTQQIEDVCWIQQLWSIRSRISAGKLSEIKPRKYAETSDVV